MVEHIFVGEYSSTNPCIICGAWEDEATSIPCKPDSLQGTTICYNPDCIVTQNYSGYFEGRNPYPCPECVVF